MFAHFLTMPLLAAEAEPFAQHLYEADLPQVAKRLSVLENQFFILGDNLDRPMSLYGPAHLDPAAEAAALHALLDSAGHIVETVGDFTRVRKPTDRARWLVADLPSPAGVAAFILPEGASTTSLEQFDTPLVHARYHPPTASWIVVGHAQRVEVMMAWLEVTL